MKKLLILAICSGPYGQAFAKDSDWKLCKGETTLFNQQNEKIVINIYEHRNGDGRAADLTFIYGGNILKGILNTSVTTVGTIKLKGTNSTFKGTAAIDYPTLAISLKGKLTVNKTATDLSATLECETL